MSGVLPERASRSGKVIVGLSGGVDSSVAALLLRRRGLEVEALFMKNWEEDDTDSYCAASADVEDARRVCETLGIRLRTVNLAADYWERVFTQFLAEYAAGRTPNPDILCNREIKFKAFLEHALDLGAEAIATGHYARVRERDGRFELLKGLDPAKDQSYFLYTLGQEPLSRTLFPVGELEKTEVRRLAAEAGLATHDKKDSTGICFIGERPFREFLARFLPAQPGNIETPDGRVVGSHQGALYYTLGQRQGLGIGGHREGSGEPWYVVGKDVARNVLIAAQGHDHPLLYSRALAAGQLHWVAGQPPALHFACTAKTRYRQPDQPCTVSALGEERIRVEFHNPQRAVTPGQSLVLYQREVCLGGGVIETTEPA